MIPNPIINIATSGNLSSIRLKPDGGGCSMVSDSTMISSDSAVGT
jgi:hypothetical protein